MRTLTLHNKVIIVPQKAPAKILRCWLAMQENGLLFDIERCEMLAVWTHAAV